MTYTLAEVTSRRVGGPFRAPSPCSRHPTTSHVRPGRTRPEWPSRWPSILRLRPARQGASDLFVHCTKIVWYSTPHGTGAQEIERERTPRPRLSRQVIAKAALGLVDRDGASSLSLRNLSRELGVGTMTLYHYVPSRDAIVRDVVAMLLDEIQLCAPAGASWAEGATAVARSYRAMARRHPRAFELLASASNREPPVLDYARRLRGFYAGLGAPPEASRRTGASSIRSRPASSGSRRRPMLRPADRAPATNSTPRPASWRGACPRRYQRGRTKAGLEILVNGLAARLPGSPTRP